MSLTLDLKPEVENALRDRAAAKGMSISDLLAYTFLPRATRKIKNGSPHDRVQSLLAQWQVQDQTPTAVPVPNDGTMTPSEALFHKWEQEDAALTEDEYREQVEQWEAFQKGIDAERTHADMRPIF